ncbi:MAG: protein-L-isoaspartate(D-aspartate) O-methyltransferase [Alphaproteobacteria bacterium]|nr:protein-L-isoaspartate(D-aspartate) O-methyltransferase [Alphaproteobacteria bacterium]
MTVATRMIRLILELRLAGVTDTRVLSALERIPRDRFVPRALQHQAYENIAIPIGHGQTLSQPLVVARMTEALDLNDRHKVLEIGTGSGYQTAVLAQLCRRVYSIERHRPLQINAENRLKRLRLNNVTLRVGDGMLGWKEQAPFDRILVTAAAAERPEVIFSQLAEGGVLILPLGAQSRDQTLLRITRRNGEIVSEELSTVRFVPLVSGAVAPPVRRRAS